MDKNDEAKRLRFIHLSDIHFSNRGATFGFDPDRELRNAVRRDIERMCNELGPANAILVSGDIAYAGKREEYAAAAEWLDDLCRAAQCDIENVLLCPGNHDVDRDVLAQNPLIDDGHTAVRRGKDFQEKDHALTSRLMQSRARVLFYEPVAAYNEFAARYQCAFFADNETYVCEREFTLNDGSILRVRGMNSSLLSGPSDTVGNLFLGSRAWTLPKQAGVEYLVMAHHPPRWLADEKEAEMAFDGAARLQLFGHEHDQRVTPGRDWIKLYAGAINPHRAEPNWQPGYNIIDVWVNTAGERTLKIEVHVRTWQGHPPQFRSLEDTGYRRTFNVDAHLEPLPAMLLQNRVANVPTSQASLQHQEGGIMTTAPTNPQQRFREVVFRFFRLSPSQKNEIVGHLKLVDEDDSRLPDVERFKLSLVRARDRDQLDQLESLMKELENN